MRRHLGMMVALLLFLGVVTAHAEVLTWYGSTDIEATGAWDTVIGPVTWSVSNDADSAEWYKWTYRYAFDSAGLHSYALSHFLMSVSEDFPATDVYGARVYWSDLDPGNLIDVSDSSPDKLWDYLNLSQPDWELGVAGPGADNPNIPGTLPDSFKWNTPEVAQGSDYIVMELVCNHTPVWGDFYAKDGKVQATETWNALWNVGFGQSVEAFRQSDGQGGYFYPDLPAGQTYPTLNRPSVGGNIGDHLAYAAVPNGAVPEPTFLLLLGVGGGLVGRYIKRRK